MNSKLRTLTILIYLVGYLTRVLADTDHLTVDAPRAQLFEGLGSHVLDVSTNSDEAQEYFNQGIAWMHTFNHDEAIRSFSKVAQLDPDCAMAWWAIALCEGPNYNSPIMDDERSSGAWGALEEALSRIDNASPKEQALIEALSHRYANPWPKDRTHLEQAYSVAMAKVWDRYPKDSNVGAMYAESMMIQRPWRLYDLDRKATGDTPEILKVLEQVMKMDPGHPGVFHLYIHAVEPSSDPSRALAAADHLRTMIPAAGHMLHMPSHIYVQT